jgi:MoaA/NifB/PqqE/SkfB family radical SAM enzyme
LLEATADFLALQVQSRLLRKRRPILAGYKLTYRCNLGCPQCPFWKMRSEELGLAGALDVVARLYELGARILILEGGEPLLWGAPGELGFLIRQAQRLFWSVGLVTNGALPLPLEPDVLWVSVDGLPETMAALRAPVFDKVMANIEACDHKRLLAHITISAVNAPELAELIRFLAPRVRGITVQFYYPYTGDTGLMLPRPQRAEVIADLLALKRAGYPILNSMAALRALAAESGWRCHPWLVASANPDGSIVQGCYLKGRAPIACEWCGFSAHTEMSLAYDLNPAAIVAGLRVFGLMPSLKRENSKR